MKRIPIKDAKHFAIANDLNLIFIYGWDGEREHIVTWGRTQHDCYVASEFGNKIKKNLNWPDELQADPNRIKKLKSRIKELEEQNENLKRNIVPLSMKSLTVEQLLDKWLPTVHKEPTTTTEIFEGHETPLNTSNDSNLHIESISDKI